MFVLHMAMVKWLILIGQKFIEKIRVRGFMKQTLPASNLTINFRPMNIVCMTDHYLNLVKTEKHRHHL